MFVDVPLEETISLNDVVFLQANLADAEIFVEEDKLRIVVLRRL